MIPQWKLTLSEHKQIDVQPNRLPVSVLSGYAVYTTFRFSIADKWLSAHLERLTHDAQTIGLQWTYSSTDLQTQIQSLLQPKEPVIRLTAYADVASYNDLLQNDPLPCALLMATRPAPPVPSQPFVLKSISHTRPLATIKWIGIGEILYLKKQAMQRGAQDILMLNVHGHITEASTANFFAIDAHGALRTPDPIRDGCLPGITRRQVLEIVEPLDLLDNEQPLSHSEIPNFQAAFLTNAVQGIIPVQQIDQIVLPWPPEAQQIVQTLQEKLQQVLTASYRT